MPLLNYTTKIDADKTAAEIARCLSMHGATAVMTEYDEKEGYVTGLAFKISIQGQTMGFKLPCDWKPVLEILKRDPKVPERMADQTQAVRVAWRIVKDWVEAQMAGEWDGMQSTLTIGYAQMFLDPLFWQALGKELGWENYCPVGHKGVIKCTSHDDYFCGSCGDEGSHVTLTNGWKHEWHRFIDFLAEGKTVAQYFEELK